MRPAEQSAALTPADGARVALVVARFNAAITDRLAEGAVAALRAAGAGDDAVERFAVPGAYELPQAARCAAETGRFEAIVCLGCVVRGATQHFDYISAATAHAIQHAAGETGVPIAFGVLTTDTWAQAEERAGDGPDNKGWEAAAAALEMAALFRRLRADGRR